MHRKQLHDLWEMRHLASVTYLESHVLKEYCINMKYLKSSNCQISEWY